MEKRYEATHLLADQMKNFLHTVDNLVLGKHEEFNIKYSIDVNFIYYCQNSLRFWNRCRDMQTGGFFAHADARRRLMRG